VPVRTALLSTGALQTPVAAQVYLSPAGVTSLVKMWSFFNSGAGIIVCRCGLVQAGVETDIAHVRVEIGQSVPLNLYVAVPPGDALKFTVFEASGVHWVMTGTHLPGVSPHPPQGPTLLELGVPVPAAVTS
jgi:hypothetical protein